ncbi:MAG: DUF6273 domain-containing protein, partial [Treponema sp.]|nr:DUF6273 domain-containing protein [Treponema sp.]
MKCPHCNSKWETDEKRSSSLASCPFCGKSLVKEEAPKKHDNSKDALAAIMKQFGPDVLLGKLNAHFPDLASVPDANKRLVYAVHELGAAKVLKNNLTASQADKEIAVKIAVRQLTDAFIVPEMAETIVSEFAAALGWQVSKPVPQPEPPSPPPQPAAAPIPNSGITIAPKINSIIRFGGYTWRVLDVQGGEALIITEEVIEQRKYNNVYKDVSWETCDLRKYLNGGFLRKFT